MCVCVCVYRGGDGAHNYSTRAYNGDFITGLQSFHRIRFPIRSTDGCVITVRDVVSLIYYYVYA